MIIAYATQFLTTASDGVLDNSPFVRALVEKLPERGVDVRQALFNVADRVVQETFGTQRPEISVSLFMPFELVPKEAGVENPSQQPPQPSLLEGEDKSAGVAAWEVYCNNDHQMSFVVGVPDAVTATKPSVPEAVASLLRALRGGEELATRWVIEPGDGHCDREFLAGLQAYLKNERRYDGPVDGVNGPLTRAALRRWAVAEQ